VIRRIRRKRSGLQPYRRCDTTVLRGAEVTVSYVRVTCAYHTSAACTADNYPVAGSTCRCVCHKQCNLWHATDDPVYSACIEDGGVLYDSLHAELMVLNAGQLGACIS
jgi:hypothetical protein